MDPLQVCYWSMMGRGEDYDCSQGISDRGHINEHFMKVCD